MAMVRYKMTNSIHTMYGSSVGGTVTAHLHACGSGSVEFAWVSSEDSHFLLRSNDVPLDELVSVNSLYDCVCMCPAGHSIQAH